MEGWSTSSFPPNFFSFWRILAHRGSLEHDRKSPTWTRVGSAFDPAPAQDTTFRPIRAQLANNRVLVGTSSMASTT